MNPLPPHRRAVMLTLNSELIFSTWTGRLLRESEMSILKETEKRETIQEDRRVEVQAMAE